MNIRPGHLLIGALASILMCASLSGCVFPQDGAAFGSGVSDESFDASFDTGVDYVEPVGVFGGWAPAYNVAPPPPRTGTPLRPNPIQGGIRPPPGGNGSHPYKPPSASHSAPSIPSAHHK